jgi:hypothetical protein
VSRPPSRCSSLLSGCDAAIEVSTPLSKAAVEVFKAAEERVDELVFCYFASKALC